jgi:hypothetical protein
VQSFLLKAQRYACQSTSKAQALTGFEIFFFQKVQLKSDTSVKEKKYPKKLDFVAFPTKAGCYIKRKSLIPNQS